MKNLFKKLGILSLLLAILSPFVELPVKANTEDCKTYIQNYFFMDVKGGALTWDPYTGRGTTGDGYRTFTQFVYAFPDAKDKKINIESVTAAYLTDKQQLESFYKRYTELLKDTNISRDDLGNFGNFKDTYIEGAHQQDLLHARWARFDESSNPVDYEVEGFDGTISEMNKFVENTYQGTVINSNLSESDKNQLLGAAGLTTIVGGATFKNENGKEIYSTLSYAGYDMMNDYLKELINEKTNVAPKNWSNSLWTTTIDSKAYTYIVFTINRHISESNLNKLKFGFNETRLKSGTTNEYETIGEGIYSTSATTIENSYTAFNMVASKDGTVTGKTCTRVTYEAGEKTNGTVSTTKGTEDCYAHIYLYDEDGELPSGINVDISSAKEYYIPHIMTVKYNVCSNSTSTPENTWTISYDTNAGTDTSVKNYPSAQTGIANGTNATLSDKIPTRDGYKFSKWCKAATGSKTEDCYSPKAVINNVTSDITLFAYWDKTGTTENKDTGIETYIISFIAIGLVAGGIYYIAKKKNLFSQV